MCVSEEGGGRVQGEPNLEDTMGLGRGHKRGENGDLHDERGMQSNGESKDEKTMSVAAAAV